MKHNEKLLHLDINFRIPADFELTGDYNTDLNNAIEAMLKYRRGPKDHKEIFEPDPEKSNYSNWWEMVCSTDRNLLGNVSLTTYNKETNEFK